MGHYASEMDPDWGKPPKSELNLREVQEDEVRTLARAIFMGFNSGSHLDSTNSEYGVKVAYAIDDLIRKRIAETLAPEIELSQE